ncbi:TD and POZ domain-containing protein 3 [Trichonephila clavipes]|nr:TD and POZ domain-containing protein 3 [Trichonephila clavipes]
MCFEIKWILEQYNYAFQKSGEYISSPVFTVDTIEKTIWKLKLFPKGNNELNKNFISIFLKREDRAQPQNVTLLYQISILGTCGEILFSKCSTKHSIAIGGSVGFPQFIERDEIFKIRKNDYLPQNALTVRCSIWNDVQDAENVCCLARTRMLIQRRLFVWNIKEFNAFQESKYEINSAEANKTMISLKLFLSSGQNSETFIRLKVCPCDQRLKLCTLRIYLIEKSRKRIECLNDEIVFNKDTNTVLSTLTFSKENLVLNKNLYLPNDILQLYCECAINIGIVYNAIERFTSGISPSVQDGNFTSDGFMSKKIRLDSKTVLAEHFKSLYKENFMCDTELKTKSGSFPAHKNILSARSPVFKAMFTNDMKEKHSKCVEIADLDDDAVQGMLLYMYTATLPDLQWDSACNLYFAADKYQILCLKSDCTFFLMKNLTQDKVYDLLILADRHQDKELMSAIQDYIWIHKGIFNTIAWKRFMEMYTKLAAEVLHQVVKK